MSYVGEPFEYDVFVSYAHAIATTETSLIRDWSRFVAGHVQELLATALNVEGSGKIQVFLDDRVLSSGQPLTQKLRDKAQRSALLLVLMSPLYPTSSWCVDELDWSKRTRMAVARTTAQCCASSPFKRVLGPSA